MKILRISLVIVLVVVAGRAFNALAQTVTILHSFSYQPLTGGYSPFAGLVQGSDGNFYGTTSNGGTNYVGNVFRISPSGSETNLHIFTGPPNDGAFPYPGPVQGSDGNFYGTTYNGGNTNCPFGCGIVFRISPSGSETNLHSFAGPPNDGANPEAGLVQGSDGNFYGTTTLGGTNGEGTVFRISPSGSETNLYSFGSFPKDGLKPSAGLVQGSDGNFYGTTPNGGTNSCDCGTVFRISPSGSYSNLYSFGRSSSDGQYPYAGLVQGSDGNLYGVTGEGMNNDGTVFRISLSGSETNLYSFGSSPNDGIDPPAALVQGSDGNFYGTTYEGGTNSCNCGTVFRISPGGSYTNLHSFAGYPTDGDSPDAWLVQGSDGNFYGTTESGGASTNCGLYGCGTVFRFSIPLIPPPYPINQITGIQLSGTNIIFSIPSIANETYQLQFSGSMKPTNWVNVPNVSVTNSIGSILTLTNFAGANQPQGFYRFDITP